MAARFDEPTRLDVAATAVLLAGLSLLALGHRLHPLDRTVRLLDAVRRDSLRSPE